MADNEADPGRRAAEAFSAAAGPRPARRAVVIAGPTASGKSALALALAEASGGVVINADSMQVYAELRILTARPEPAEEARAPHRLYGHVSARERYTVMRWLADCAGALAAAERAGQLPIIVGGTGLYLSALTAGLSEIPAVPEDLKAEIAAETAGMTAAALHARLAARDEVMAARLRPADRQRILRALEVLAATGRSLSHWQGRRTAPLVDPGSAVTVVIAPERETLRARIARRFEAMVAGGGLDEAAGFAALSLDPALPAMKAIGLPEMMAAATGARPVGEAVAAAVTATRQFAKRQETWFRNQMPGWRRIDLPAPSNILATARQLAQETEKGLDPPARGR